jgi:hypothetical protein
MPFDSDLIKEQVALHSGLRRPSILPGLDADAKPYQGSEENVNKEFVDSPIEDEIPDSVDRTLNRQEVVPTPSLFADTRESAELADTAFRAKYSSNLAINNIIGKLDSEIQNFSFEGVKMTSDFSKFEEEIAAMFSQHRRQAVIGGNKGSRRLATGFSHRLLNDEPHYFFSDHELVERMYEADLEAATTELKERRVRISMKHALKKLRAEKKRRRGMLGSEWVGHLVKSWAGKEDSSRFIIKSREIATSDIHFPDHLITQYFGFVNVDNDFFFVLVNKLHHTLPGYESPVTSVYGVEGSKMSLISVYNGDANLPFRERGARSFNYTAEDKHVFELPYELELSDLPRYIEKKRGSGLLFLFGNEVNSVV